MKSGTACALFLMLLTPGVGAQPLPGPASPPAAADKSSPDWLLWGGPGRNFISPARGLAESWPPTGPPVLWRRELGEGYAAIAAEGGRLYTTYHRVQPYWLVFSEQQEVVAALDARTGATVWEYASPSTFRSAPGPGPHVMPQIVGGRLFTIGSSGKLLALDKGTGKLLWQHDLYEEFGGTRLEYGYSSHPLPYKDNLIVLVGGQGKGLISFKQATGEVVWARGSFKNAHSAPILIDVGGQSQVVALVADHIFGADPDTGTGIWSFPHKTDYGLAVSTPVWGDDGLLFFSSSYGGGGRALRLSRDNGKTRVEGVWHNPRVRVHFGSVVRLGDVLYASSGHDGPAPLTAVDVRSGAILWQSREFAKASFVWADGKLIVVDQDGYLALATATPDGLKIHAKVPLLSSNAWTAPTLAGSHLYIRDRKIILALDIGRP